MTFDGMACNMNNLAFLSNAKTRSICSENRSGEVSGGGKEPVPLDPETNQPTGCSRELGKGWKIHPSDIIKPGETYTMADIEGPGCIQHMWMTPTGSHRHTILRIYWDGQEIPSVECPVGDFFASAYADKGFAQISSLAVCVNPGSGFNCYWPMPFGKRCRITLENIGESDSGIFYQIDYALGEPSQEMGYFHAQFRRTNPLPYKKVYTIVDNIRGKGHYIGTYMAWGVNNTSWWGEGEIKFYMDGDIPEGKTVDESVAEHGGDCFPTICGTGTEDYFCGSYNFEDRQSKQYKEFTTPYAGLPHIVRPDGVYNSQTRFSMYRWHITDPIRFEDNLAVTIQALGWRSGRRFLPLQDDISSVAFWYQTLPTAEFPELPDKDYLEII
ncbi:MAG: glycoside hydrolase family 172 protein [Sedimentisphaeraceae bacterium JB056]